MKQNKKRQQTISNKIKSSRGCRLDIERTPNRQETRQYIQLHNGGPSSCNLGKRGPSIENYTKDDDRWAQHKLRVVNPRLNDPLFHNVEVRNSKPEKGRWGLKILASRSPKGLQERGSFVFKKRSQMNPNEGADCQNLEVNTHEFTFAK